MSEVLGESLSVKGKILTHQRITVEYNSSDFAIDLSDIILKTQFLTCISMLYMIPGDLFWKKMPEKKSSNPSVLGEFLIRAGQSYLKLTKNFKQIAIIPSIFLRLAAIPACPQY